MEAFEKWLSGIHKTGLPLSPGDCLHNTQAGLRVGWRASLEWMKAKLECEIEPGDIGYFIDKELEEK